MSKKNDVFKHVFSKDRVFNYYFDVKDEHKLSKFDFNNKIFSSLSSTAGITNNEKEQAYEEYSKLYDSLEKKHHDKSANVIRKIAKSKLIDPIMAKKKEEQQKKNMAAIKIQTKIRELNLKKDEKKIIKNILDGIPEKIKKDKDIKAADKEKFIRGILDDIINNANIIIEQKDKERQDTVDAIIEKNTIKFAPKLELTEEEQKTNKKLTEMMQFTPKTESSASSSSSSVPRLTADEIKERENKIKKKEFSETPEEKRVKIINRRRELKEKKLNEQIEKGILPKTKIIDKEKDTFFKNIINNSSKDELLQLKMQYQNTSDEQDFMLYLSKHPRERAEYYKKLGEVANIYNNSDPNMNDTVNSQNLNYLIENKNIIKNIPYNKIIEDINKMFISGSMSREEFDNYMSSLNEANPNKTQNGVIYRQLHKPVFIKKTFI